MVRQRGSGRCRISLRGHQSRKRPTTSWRRTSSTEGLVSCSWMTVSGTISSGLVRYTPAVHCNNKIKNKKGNALCYILLFCVFRAVLSVCILYGPFCHGALKLDIVCNIFSLNIVSVYIIQLDDCIPQ